MEDYADLPARRTLLCGSDTTSTWRIIYMTRVAEVRELESYAEAAKDANWRTAMEEEMHALVENETWDLIDAPKGVKPIGCRSSTTLTAWSTGTRLG